MAPIFMFLMAYWAFGNQQMFFGLTSIIDHANRIPDPNHPLMMGGFNQTHMILMVFLFLVFLRFFQIAWRYFNEKVLKRDMDENDFLDMDVEESIDLYWRSLEGTDQKN